ncbi:unnamed protein product [Absidia cylindrospora]
MAERNGNFSPMSPIPTSATAASQSTSTQNDHPFYQHNQDDDHQHHLHQDSSINVHDSTYQNSYCPSPILPTYEETVRPGRHGHDMVNDIEEQQPQQSTRDVGSNNEEKISRKKQRKKAFSYLCCICCPCFPMWTRCICCFLLFAIVVFAIAAGILAALFQMPTVTFNGPTDDPNGLPRFQNLPASNNASGAFNINLGLNFTIVNPNLEGLIFEKIKAIAYYPIQPDRPLGGGNMTNLRINPAATTQFIFPFQIHYDPSVDPGYAILFDMMTKCGLLGVPQKQDITVNYDLKPTVRVIGVPVSPTIRQSASFPCPIQGGQLSMPKGLLSVVP